MGHAPEPSLRALRGVAFGILAFILTFLSWFTALVLVILQPRKGHLASRVGSLWGRAMVSAAGGRLEIHGAEHFAPDVPRMLVANHASYLDPLVMLAVFPGTVRFILKKELGKVPFIGWHAKAGGHFLLDRKNPRVGHEILQRAIRRCRRHALSPIVFAEGTRSRDGRLQPLKPGAFQLAVDGGFEVQPIAILGTAQIMPKGALGPHRSGPVVVRVGPALSVEGLEGSPGRKVVAERVREALLALGVPDGAA